MKSWNNPEIWQLGVEMTAATEKYEDPNTKPSQHPDWVWCFQHNQWHPKNHS